MNAYFADTAFFIALINPQDRAHAIASRFASTIDRRVVTTHWVIIEVANHCAARDNRQIAIDLFDTLKKRSWFSVLPVDQVQFDEGYELFRQRTDKNWSVTDCISMNVMRQNGITDALTSDHHFEQAGFTVLLK